MKDSRIDITMNPSKIVRHYKGGLYQVLCTGIDTSTGDEAMIYKELSGDYNTYIKPLDEFWEKIQYCREDNITNQMYRFENYYLTED